MLDCDGIKNYYLSSQKELDTDEKAMEQFKFIGRLSNDANDANPYYLFRTIINPMIVVLILEKIKETNLKFTQRRVKIF